MTADSTLSLLRAAGAASGDSEGQIGSQDVSLIVSRGRVLQLLHVEVLGPVLNSVFWTGAADCSGSGADVSIIVWSHAGRGEKDDFHNHH